MGPRATITHSPGIVTKQYHDPADAHPEIHWYTRLADQNITPRLIDADPDTGTLTIAAHPPADPSYRPAQQLAELLHQLQDIGISHRDVHPGNLVQGPSGPLLIDWETGYPAPGYDLHGPEATGIPIPDIHQAIRSPNSPHGYVMWVGSDHRASIRNQWGIDPADLTEDP